MKTLTRAELEHVQRTLQSYRDLIEDYPEISSDNMEDELAVAQEITDE